MLETVLCGHQDLVVPVAALLLLPPKPLVLLHKQVFFRDVTAGPCPLTLLLKAVNLTRSFTKSGAHADPGIPLKQWQKSPPWLRRFHLKDPSAFWFPSGLPSLRLWPFCIRKKYGKKISLPADVEQKGAARYPESPRLGRWTGWGKSCFTHVPECPPPEPSALYNTLTLQGDKNKSFLQITFVFFPVNCFCSKNSCYTNPSWSLKRSRLFPKIGFLF